MGIRVELEMLAVLLLLTPAVIDAVVLTKCQLVKELNSSVPKNVDHRKDVIAKLVHQAEVVAKFDTSFTSEIKPPVDLPKVRPARSVNTTNPPKIATKATTKPPTTTTKATTKAPKTTTKAPKTTTTTKATTKPPKTTTTTAQPAAKPMLQQILNVPSVPAANQTVQQGGSGSVSDQAAPSSNDTQPAMWTVYGVYMIPDAVACVSPNKPSFNVCNMDCSGLVTDDITAATKCMLTIFDYNAGSSSSSSTSDQKNAANIIEQLVDMFNKPVPGLNTTDYLSECVGK